MLETLVTGFLVWVGLMGPIIAIAVLLSTFGGKSHG